ncbi:MAG: hypothetical protein ACOH2F_03750 [Cellulomonas sp.]
MSSTPQDTSARLLSVLVPLSGEGRSDSYREGAARVAKTLRVALATGPTTGRGFHECAQAALKRVALVDVPVGTPHAQEYLDGIADTRDAASTYLRTLLTLGHPVGESELREQCDGALSELFRVRELALFAVSQLDATVLMLSHLSMDTLQDQDANDAVIASHRRAAKALRDALPVRTAASA